MVPGLHQFLKDYPGMAIKPAASAGLILQGTFSFGAEPNGKPEIIDEYRLRIEVPQAFPKELPGVTELDGKIPQTADFHVNRDGTLCLGAPLRLMWKLSTRPTLAGFASLCLVPYLYGASHKLRYGGPFPFGELGHDYQAVIDDYVEVFGLKHPDQGERALELLLMKKRVANKQPCPCDCGKRLGKCKFNRKILAFRKIAPPKWLRDQLRRPQISQASNLVSRPRAQHLAD